MINKLILYCLCLSSVLGQDIPNIEYSNWKVLQDDEVWVGWSSYKNYNWGKAKITFKSSIDQVASVLENRQEYTNIFKRMTKCEENDEGVVYIVLDMPFPISHRDYVVYYKNFNDGNHKVYHYYSTTHVDFPLDPNNVRLPRATGEWRLIPINKMETELIYTWNGELLGDFPNFALTRAWQEQGNEVMGWLKEALNK